MERVQKQTLMYGQILLTKVLIPFTSEKKIFSKNDAGTIEYEE